MRSFLNRRATWARQLCLLATGLACILTSLPLGAQLTVQDALSAPFRNQLTASPSRARLAWFTDQEGRRNVWVAGTHEAARAVTSNVADDGQDIDDIAWSRDGERLAWTRGTGAAGSEHALAANPAELPGPIQQHIEWADLREQQAGHAATVHIVPDGHAPVFTADGVHLLFLRRGAVFIADLRSNAPHLSATSSTDDVADPHEPTTQDMAVPRASSSEPTGGPTRQLLYVRGTVRGLRLSPDGTQLAFVSGRGDHSFIGVHTFATKTLTWMDPGTGLDHDPVWSTDGKSIAFLREVPVVSPIADRWMREGGPWSIHLANVSTGAGHEVWHADPGPGSLFHEVAAKDQIFWTREGSIVFPWEKSGFVQLYRITLQGKATPEALSFSSSGSAGSDAIGWEVDAVSSNGSQVVFSANQHRTSAADVQRRHIWIAGGRNAAPRQLTTGKAIETSPTLLSDGAVAYLRGSATEPLAPVLLHDPVHSSSGREAQQLTPGWHPDGHAAAGSFVDPEPVSFPAADGMPIDGELFLPPACAAAPRPAAAACTHLPAVVFFHGGSRRQMLLGFHPMQYYAQTYEFNQYLASRGFVVLSVNYRSGTGYGLNFRQALHYGANGASEDNDVVGAARYLQTRPEIDRKRIGAWGGSYGGYLTALALARHSDLYAAGVDLHGVHDWSLELDLWKPTDEPGVDETAIARLAFQSSPMSSLDTWKSPVLLMQGDDDRNVLFAQTVRLAAELHRRGVPVEEKVFPDEVHDFLLHRNWITAYQFAAEFLERHLKPR